MSRTKAFRSALAALVVVGSSLATGHAQAEPEVLHVPGEVHLATSVDGYPYPIAHTIRHANGWWDGFGTLDSGEHSALTSVIVNGEEHLLYGAANHHPPLQTWIVDHIRHADGTWTRTSSPSLGIDRVTLDLAAAAVSGEVHVVRRSLDPVARHHVRHADGTWSERPELPAAARTGSVALAGFGDELRLLLADPAKATLGYHVARADGTWSPGVDVPFNPPAQGVMPRGVEAAQVGADLHAVVQGTDGLLYHAKRDPNGNWARFHGIGSQVPVPPEVSSVSITAAGAALHVAINAGGRLFHSIRFADGTWQPFGDVLLGAGRITPSGQVTIAGT
jgi:hypothetical protein